jgi:alpha-L-fucosidase
MTIEHMNYKSYLKLVTLSAWLSVSLLSCNLKKNESAKNDSVIDSPKKLEWFQEAKFGLFIHWGLYSVPAGEWNGRKNYGEWIQYSANIPGEEYEKLAKQFNPVRFIAKEWVSMAKQAGMKYIVITAKHHEGFCMFDSKLTNYDIVDATPYGKDPMKALAEECRKQGLKLCFYYSIKDWHHPQFPVKYTYHTKQYPEGFHGFPNRDADYKKYFAYLEGQVKELLTNYGDIGIIWWDWSGPAFDPDELQNREMALALVDSIHKWQPKCLINNRMGGIGADYGTPEQEIPGGSQSTAFEVCMTLNGSWGYNKADTTFKSADEVISNLVDIASKGGNYLLNVGPTSEGVMPEKAQAILKKVGNWLSVNGEAIYGTTSGGPSVRWNNSISGITAKPNTLYLHLFRWPGDNMLYLNDFVNEFNNAYLLADKEKKPLKVDVHSQGLMIYLPEQPIDSIDNIIVIKYKGPYKQFRI